MDFQTRKLRSSATVGLNAARPHRLRPRLMRLRRRTGRAAKADDSQRPARGGDVEVTLQFATGISIRTGKFLLPGKALSFQKPVFVLL